MAKTFGLGEDARFTMLSGIAHDPIQRDSEFDLQLSPFFRVLTFEGDADISSSLLFSLHTFILRCPITYSYS